MDLRVAGEDHLSFPVPDFEDAIKTLEKHGLKIHADRKGQQGWFADPDGRTIEFGVYGPTPAFKPEGTRPVPGILQAASKL